MKNNIYLYYVLIIISVIMFLLNMLFIHIMNDKTAYIRGLKGQKNLCEEKYDSLVQDYEKLEMRVYE